MVLVEWCEQGHFAGKRNKSIAVDASLVDGWMNGLLCLQPVFLLGKEFYPSGAGKHELRLETYGAHVGAVRAKVSRECPEDVIYHRTVRSYAQHCFNLSAEIFSA